MTNENNQYNKQNDQHNNQSSANNQSNQNKGFAAMDADKQREIARQGGIASHEKGSAHQFNSEEGREAGRKGGQNSHGGHNSESSNR